MSASASSIVDGGAPVVAAASAPVGGVSAAQSGSGSSGKGCSVCQRVLHSSAFSATQARAPAKSRKCMECVVNGQAGVVATEAAAAPAASATAAPQADNKKAKAKTNTTGQDTKNIDQQPVWMKRGHWTVRMLGSLRSTAVTAE